jgi:hypothetical protein
MFSKSVIRNLSYLINLHGNLPQVRNALFQCQSNYKYRAVESYKMFFFQFFKCKPYVKIKNYLFWDIEPCIAITTAVTTSTRTYKRIFQINYADLSCVHSPTLFCA